MTRPDIAVLGGGLLGRCLAWRASRCGASVALYDACPSSGEGSAAWVAAGMIAPTAESAGADAEIVAMGRNSLRLWPRWLAELPFSVFYRDTGTLVLWHSEDGGEVLRMERMLAVCDSEAYASHVHGSELSELEPLVPSKFQQALYLRDDAQVDNRGLLKALAAGLEQTGVECHWQTLIRDDEIPSAGVIVDCRGMGARADWPILRGVRGEIMRLHAPAIKLSRMLRLLHLRFPVYIVPRSDGVLVVGATSVEAEDYSAVSFRGALELLTSSYSLLPVLAEARILEFATQVRPALPNNRPAFRYDHARNILRVNGLYRHGFLLTPTIVEEALSVLGVSSEVDSGRRWACLRSNDLQGGMHLCS